MLEDPALMSVFPQWAGTFVPQGYWRTQFIKDLMLEEELPGADALNWRLVKNLEEDERKPDRSCPFYLDFRRL
ncbi:hypothetical protein N8T08_004125 [Aspergillus melleus]|uniref:Uncharacterized protein n=1 Tax=Aspergillus melleus TaxID=138277 RepID=A0ACC3B561_9EURO|nr:hypothetical protein N8T08_004125 [Aspergillus melleus]